MKSARPQQKSMKLKKKKTSALRTAELAVRGVRKESNFRRGNSGHPWQQAI